MLTIVFLAVLFVATDSSSDIKEATNNNFVYMRAMKKRETLINIGKPSPSDLHQVTIAIKQNNIDRLESELLDRSTPGTSNYQQWMRQDEIIQMTSNKQATDAIFKWCRENDLRVEWTNKHREYFQVSTNVSHWESLLNTEFFKWEDHHPHSVSYMNKPNSFPRERSPDNDSDQVIRKDVLRAEYFSIPSTLAPHVHDIFGVCDAPSVMRKYLEKHQKDTAETSRHENGLRTEATAFTITKVISVYKIPPMNSSSK